MRQVTAALLRFKEARSMDRKNNRALLDQQMHEFLALQQCHLKKIKAGDLSGITEIGTARAKAFSNLKHQLAVLVNAPTKNEDSDTSFELNDYKSQAAEILKLDEELKHEILRYKACLKNSLNRIKQGKNALAGYKKVNCINHNMPHVLSMSR